MTRTVIIYNGMLFASPRHLMNYFRSNNLNPGFDIKLLTQYVYKEIDVVKGIKLTYRHYDLTKSPEFENIYKRIKSLTRSGKGYIMGMKTPLDYYEDVIRPLMKFSRDPVKAAIDKAIEEGIGTEKDFKELLKGE